MFCECSESNFRKYFTLEYDGEVVWHDFVFAHLQLANLSQHFLERGLVD